MGSSRLAGKVLKPLAGRPALDWVVLRAQASGAFDEVVLATTTQPQDDALRAHGDALGLRVVRGSERITSDCPLIEPAVLAAMAARWRDTDRFDVITNAVNRTFPRGLDTEMFTRAALDAAAIDARDPAEREHVTVFLYRHPERFRIAHFTQSTDHTRERWTLDTVEDYALLTRIFDASPNPLALTQQQVLTLLDTNPTWRTLTAHIEPKKT